MRDFCFLIFTVLVSLVLLSFTPKQVSDAEIVVSKIEKDLALRKAEYLDITMQEDGSLKMKPLLKSLGKSKKEEKLCDKMSEISENYSRIEKMLK